MFHGQTDTNINWSVVQKKIKITKVFQYFKMISLTHAVTDTTVN